MTLHRTDPLANQVAEYQKIQTSRYDRWDERLCPDSHKSGDLFTCQRVERNPGILEKPSHSIRPIAKWLLPS